MNLTLITPPTWLIVSLEEIKSHCRIDGTDEDDTLTSYLTFAQAYAEKFRGEQFLSAVYLLELPSPVTLSCRDREILELSASASYLVSLPKPPLQSIETIEYVGMDGINHTISSGYRVLSGRKPALVVFDNSFPAIANQENALQITFTAGYESASDVPEHIRQAVRLLAADAYKNRESTTEQHLQEIPVTVDRLLSLDRIR